MLNLIIVVLSISILTHASTLLPSVNIEIPEELPISTRLTCLSDLYLVASNLKKVPETFSLLEKSQYYTVERDSTTNQFFLILKARLDRESLCQLEGTCCPSRNDTNNPERCQQTLVFLVQNEKLPKVYFNVNIFVKDINDNAPEFREKFADIELPEDAKIGHSIALPIAVDPDAPNRNVTQNYRLIMDNDPEGIFSVDSQHLDNEIRPRLVVKGNLDLLKETSYTGRLLAEDDGIPKRSSEIPVKISVLDVNNNPPKFSQKEYTLELVENQKPGRIFQLKATDLDSGDQNNLRYYFTKDEQLENGKFVIEPRTGNIILKGSLDFEEESRMNLPVVVTDGKFTDESVIRIDVGNVNDNYPVISLSSYLPNATEEVQAHGSSAVLPTLVVYVKENGPPNEHIATLSYTDRDEYHIDNNRPDCSAEGNLLRLEIIATPGKKKIFSVALTEGVSLDREKIPQYRIRIQCTDNVEMTPNSNRLTSYLELHIIVVDENDCEPELARDFEVHVRENLRENTFITKVRIEDPDEGTTNVFAYKLGKAFNFTYMKEAVDRELIPYEELFIIDRDNGNLYSKYSFDRELIKSFEQEIHISDGVHNVTQPIRIIIKDENDCTPQFDHDAYVVDLLENVKAPKMLMKLGGFDKDVDRPNNQVTYELETMSVHDSLGDWLRVYETGEVWLKSPGKYTNQRSPMNYYYHPVPIDREKDSVHFFTVTIKDRGNPQLVNKTTLEINIIDVNDNKPEWHKSIKSHQIVNITRDIAVGSRIFKLLAVDNDSGLNGQFVYRIISGNDAGYFYLNETSGLITLEKAIPSLPRNRYFIYDGQFKLYIQAVDLGEPPLISDTIQLDIRAIKDTITTTTTTTNQGGTLHNQGFGDVLISGDDLTSDNNDGVTFRDSLLNNSGSSKNNYSDYLMLIGLIVVTFIALVLILVLLTIFRCHQQKQIRQQHQQRTTNPILINHELNRASMLAASGRWNYDTIHKVVPFPGALRNEKIDQTLGNNNKTHSFIYKPNDLDNNNIQNRDNLYLMNEKKSATLKTISDDQRMKNVHNQTLHFRNTFDESKLFRAICRDSVNRGEDYTPLNFLSTSPDISDDLEMKDSLMRDIARGDQLPKNTDDDVVDKCDFLSTQLIEAKKTLSHQTNTGSFV